MNQQNQITPGENGRSGTIGQITISWVLPATTTAAPTTAAPTTAAPPTTSSMGPVTSRFNSFQDVLLPAGSRVEFSLEGGSGGGGQGGNIAFGQMTYGKSGGNGGGGGRVVGSFVTTDPITIRAYNGVGARGGLVNSNPTERAPSGQDSYLLIKNAKNNTEYVIIAGGGGGGEGGGSSMTGTTYPTSANGGLGGGVYIGDTNPVNTSVQSPAPGEPPFNGYDIGFSSVNATPVYLATTAPAFIITTSTVIGDTGIGGGQGGNGTFFNQQNNRFPASDGLDGTIGAFSVSWSSPITTSTTTASPTTIAPTTTPTIGNHGAADPT
jgi:hypothetical protein